MGPGLPGIGIAGIFYAIAALLAPFREIALTVRGKSSLERWRLVGRQFALAVFIVGAIVGFYLGLAALERRGVLSWSGGSRLLTHVPNVLFTVAALGVVLLLASAYGWWVRSTSKEEPADSIAAAHRGGLVLVGDPRQLPEIEAGGGFISLTERLELLELRLDALVENRRRHEVWERETLGLFRAATATGRSTRFDRGRIAISAS